VSIQPKKNSDSPGGKKRWGKWQPEKKWADASNIKPRTETKRITRIVGPVPRYDPEKSQSISHSARTRAFGKKMVSS